MRAFRFCAAVGLITVFSLVAAGCGGGGGNPGPKKPRKVATPMIAVKARDAASARRYDVKKWKTAFDEEGGDGVFVAFTPEPGVRCYIYFAYGVRTNAFNPQPTCVR